MEYPKSKLNERLSIIMDVIHNCISHQDFSQMTEEEIEQFIEGLSTDLFTKFQKGIPNIYLRIFVKENAEWILRDRGILN